MRSRLLLLVVSLALVAAASACSGAAVGSREIAISMTDAMTFTPNAITVKRGETVTFKVKNAGEIAHEFFIGSEAAQDEHEIEMKQTTAMGHDHATGVHVEAGNSKPLTVTFSTAGTFLMGCHEPGHWGAGMKGTVSVEG